MNKSKALLFILAAALLIPSATNWPTASAASSTDSQDSSSVTVPNRTFHLVGKGKVKDFTDVQRRRFHFSQFEPTGFYASPNETLTVDVQGLQAVKAYIGTYGYDRTWESPPDKFTLQPGANSILSIRGGVLYFSNENTSGSVDLTVTNGGTPIPLFVLGQTTQTDWDNMLQQYPNAYAVELKGNRSLITVSSGKARQYLSGKNPAPLMQKHDEIIAMEDSVSGVGLEYTGVAKADPHYIHFVENIHPEPNEYMYATDYYTSYIPDVVNKILDVNTLLNDGWGPWHEQGHQRQQNPWTWDALSEVTVNVSSLSVQRKLGIPSRLEMDKVYNDVFSYLNQPANQKNFDSLNDDFTKLALFWQLDLAFGEHFYPQLHQQYRILPDELQPKNDDEKKQLFIMISSKVANRNLVPFFEQWGIQSSQETRDAVAALPSLTKQIWLGRDANPLVENIVQPYRVPSGVPIPQQVELGQGKAQITNLNQWLSGLAEDVHVTDVFLKSQQLGASTALVTIEDTAGNVNGIQVPIQVVTGDTMIFQGLGDWNSAALTLDHTSQTLLASTPNRESTIHSYFTEPYYTVKIFPKNSDEPKLQASAKGTDTPAAFVDALNNAAFEYGDVIQITHEEPSRFLVYDNATKLAPNTAKTQTYTITTQGFVPRSLPTGVAVPQTVEIGVNKEQITNFQAWVTNLSPNTRIVGITDLDTTVVGNTNAKVKLQDELLGDTSIINVPVQVVYGDSLVFQGLSDWNSATLTLDHTSKTILASTPKRSTSIHYYFSETYYSVKVLDKNTAVVKFQASAKGTDTPAAFVDALNKGAFEYGDVIQITHEEPFRFIVYDNGTKLAPNTAKTQTYTITDQGFVPEKG